MKRVASMSGIVLALALSACGGGRPTGDAGHFIGTWDGSSRHDFYGSLGGAPTALVHISASGGNAVVVQDVCGGGSGPSGTVTSPTTMTLAGYECPPVRIDTCAAVTFSISAGGTANIANDLLTVDVTGSLTGCGQTRPVYWTFTGMRTSTAPPPPPPPPFSPPPAGRCTTYEGNVTLNTSADWNALVDGGCTAITGDLIVSTVDATGPLTAPALKSIGGALIITENLQLTSTSFPALTSVGDMVSVGSNPVLASFELPALPTLGRPLLVADDPQLTSISAPALTTAGIVYLTNNALLTSVNLPALTTAGSVLLTDNALLTQLSLPLLTSIHGTVDSLGLVESRGDLEIERNARLETLELPALASLSGYLFIWDNPTFPECMALAFRDHLMAAHLYTGYSVIRGNDIAGICP